VEHPSGSIELEPLEETRFELGSCLDLNAKPVRTDEFGRQLGSRAAGPRHGVHSQLLPSKKRADMAQRGPVVGRRRREQSERFAVAGGPCRRCSRVTCGLCARAARRSPHRGSVTGARAFGLHCPHPPGYAFRAPFQGRSIHWVTWAGTPLFWALFFGCPHP